MKNFEFQFSCWSSDSHFTGIMQSSVSHQVFSHQVKFCLMFIKAINTVSIIHIFCVVCLIYPLSVQWLVLPKLFVQQCMNLCYKRWNQNMKGTSDIYPASLLCIGLQYISATHTIQSCYYNAVNNKKSQMHKVYHYPQTTCCINNGNGKKIFQLMYSHHGQSRVVSY